MWFEEFLVLISALHLQKQIENSSRRHITKTISNVYWDTLYHSLLKLMNIPLQIFR